MPRSAGLQNGTYLQRFLKRWLILLPAVLLLYYLDTRLMKVRFTGEFLALAAVGTTFIALWDARQKNEGT